MKRGHIKRPQPQNWRQSFLLTRFRPLDAKIATVTVARLLLAGVNAFCAAHLFVDLVGRPALTDGPSMLPTLAVKGDFVWEERWSVRRDPVTFTRGELVTFKSPLNPLRIAVKRVIGLPGDIICVDPMGEYAASTEHVIVPQGHIWVNGDNLAHSRDSRLYGPIPMGLVQGRVTAKIWPSESITMFKSPLKPLDS